MGSFRENLRYELDYQDLTVKELSVKTNIPKATLDCYLGARATLPTVDVAVKIATVLGVSVEYLVNGIVRDQSGTILQQVSDDLTKYYEFRDVLDDLSLIASDVREPIKAMIKTAAERERAKHTQLRLSEVAL
ncbi:MAG: hypothetical protein Ta2A_11700 [Treponemataceae bacterium]|nr:MAG: hypothetical protein Ta2A_11700 [Treponemataceae bacterium]